VNAQGETHCSLPLASNESSSSTGKKRPTLVQRDSGETLREPEVTTAKMGAASLEKEPASILV
jgi:hypothetical protein